MNKIQSQFILQPHLSDLTAQDENHRRKSLTLSDWGPKSLQSLMTNILAFFQMSMLWNNTWSENQTPAQLERKTLSRGTWHFLRSTPDSSLGRPSNTTTLPASLPWEGCSPRHLRSPRSQEIHYLRISSNCSIVLTSTILIQFSVCTGDTQNSLPECKNATSRSH